MKSLGSAIGISSLLHIFIGVALTVSIDHKVDLNQPELSVPTPVIQAVMVEQETFDEKATRIRQEQLAQEQERLRQQAREKRERELRIKQENERKAREAKKKRDAEAKRKRDAEEKAKKEKERKEKEAAEKKRREQERAEQERLMKEQLAQEQVEMQQRRRQVLSEVDKYQALIKQTIQRAWRKEEYMEGKYCRLNIRLASNGLVTQLQVLEGDDIVCQSAQVAIFKIDVLPVSPNPDVFNEMRSINLTLGDRE